MKSLSKGTTPRGGFSEKKGNDMGLEWKGGGGGGEDARSRDGYKAEQCRSIRQALLSRKYSFLMRKRKNPEGRNDGGEMLKRPDIV